MLATNEVNALKFSGHGAKAILRTICGVSGMEFLDARIEAQGALLKLMQYRSSLALINKTSEVYLEHLHRANEAAAAADEMDQQSKQTKDESANGKSSASMAACCVIQ
jgi:hypothetical protein